MIAHTPGPWNVETMYRHGVRESCQIVAGPFDVVADLGACGDVSIATSEDEANARLIAAAPDMLAALQDIAALADEESDWTVTAIRIARAAIAKAEGRS